MRDTDTSPAGLDVVRLDGPGDLAAAVPHLLGFVPRQSLVAISLRGGGRRVGLTLRLDLVPSADEALADEVASRMVADDADEVVLVVHTEGPDDDGRRPGTALVAAARRRLDAVGVGVRDALLVRGGRWSSYLCDDVRCCPADGLPIDSCSPGATAIAAAHALHGRAVVASREAVVAQLEPIGGITAVSMRQATERAWSRVAAGVDPSLDVVRRTAELTRRYADPRARADDDEVATLVVGLHDSAGRDRVLALARDGDTDAMRLLFADVVRRAQRPWDAPACTVLAWLAYLDGHGVVASAALERALRTDPDYSLAALLATALVHQMPPAALRVVLSAVAARRDAASPPPEAA